MKKVLFSLLVTLALPAFLQAQSWIEKDLGFQTGSVVQQISIVDSNVAWCLTNTTNQRRFSRTVDGGMTWTAASMTSFPTGVLSDIFALDSNTAYVANGNPAGVFKTTNAGATWTQLGDSSFFTGPASWPVGIHFWDQSNGFVFGDPRDGRPEMYTTNDAGNTWVAVDTNNIPPSTIGTYLNFGPISVVDSVIWFTSADGQLFKSTNRGQNWTADILDPAILYSVSFLDDKMHGLAFGSMLWTTSDGGTNWTSIPTSAHSANHVFRGIPGTSIFVAVGAGMNMDESSMSTDFGYTWTVIDSGVNTYGGLAFYDINTGFAGGVPQNLSNGIYKWSATTVGITEEVNKGQMNLYPNPGTTAVKVTSDQEMQSIVVHDILGNEVLQREIHSYEATLDLTGLQSGVYFIEAMTESGKVTRKYLKW